MGGYTYDELVRLHAQITKQVNQLTVEGLIEFGVNQHKGRIEVLVDGPYDHEALKALVAGIPRDAYEVLETTGSAEAAAVSPAGPLRRFLGRLGRFMRRRRSGSYYSSALVSDIGWGSSATQHEEPPHANHPAAGHH